MILRRLELDYRPTKDLYKFVRSSKGILAAKVLRQGRSFSAYSPSANLTALQDQICFANLDT